MKIAVVGPGAIGCLFAGALSRGEHEVWLVDRQHERARLLARRGIWVSGVTGEFNARVRTTASPQDASDVELVLIAVKSYDTRGAGETAQHLVGDGATVLTIQNGLGNVEVLQEILGEDRVVGGVTSQAATLIAPGQVHHAAQGITTIGEPTGEVTERLMEMVEAFSSAGLRAELTTNLTWDLWSKLVVNAGINAVAALAQVRNGGILESQHLRALLSEAVAEASAVAKAKGIKLPRDDMGAYAQELCQRTANNVNSMLQDIHRRRQTEVDAINGAVAREGEAAGVPTPTNRALAALVQGLEDTYAARVAR